MPAKTIQVFEPGKGISPKYVRAVNAIMDKEIPLEAIETRPGKSGKTFKYAKHTWVTETLQQGLGNAWGFEVLGWEIFNEIVLIGKEKVETPMRSIVTNVRLTLYVPLENGEILTRVVGDVGVFEPNEAMSTAMGVASAVSRGLCRVVMRALGLGLQFYKSEEQSVTPAQAWTTLKTFAINQGSSWDDEFQRKYIALLKEKDITRENIVDRFSEAYEILAGLLGKTVQLEEMPE